MEAYKNDFNDRYESGELLSENNIGINDSTRYFTDNGRVVYGGGGIIPDVFVPLDTQSLSETFLKLNRQIPNFTFRFVDKNKAQLEQMDIVQFINDLYLCIDIKLRSQVRTDLTTTNF